MVKKDRPGRSLLRKGSRPERNGVSPLVLGWSVVLLGLAGIVGWGWSASDSISPPRTSAILPIQPMPVATTARTGAPAGGSEAEPSAAHTTAKSDSSATTKTAAFALSVSPDSPAPPALPSGRLAQSTATEAAAGRLAPVPDPALVLQTEKGLLPVIGPDGRQPWQVYARPFEAAEDTPRIAIIMGDMGLSAPATNTAIQQLPGTVTLAFAPYATNLQDWIGKSRAAGHEVMLQLPMEPYDYPANDPGPNALLTTLSAGANLERLEWLLSRFAGYTGVTNYMGSKFTTSAKDIRPVMEALKSRGLMFIDAKTSERSVASRIARDLGVPVAINNRYIDNEASRRKIDERLGDLERIARASGAALGIAFPYPVTIERLAKWASELDAKGIRLAPASAVANRQTMR